VSIFFIGDTHFGHAAINRMCNRPFSNVDSREMDEALVANWNAVVRPGALDTVIHLGDFAHRYRGDLAKLFASLHGRKVLIRGNHDHAETCALPWESVHDVLHTSIDSNAVTLCHYAWRVWPRQRKGALMLFGHSHGRLAGNRQSADVGVDVMGWSPVRLHAIKAMMAELPPLADSEDGLENEGELRP
jgi:calcineurin-like phosphoesterase family protein